MGKPLSVNLRERVVGAIAQGMSRRAAATRFGVSAASAVGGGALPRDLGNPAAKPRTATRVRRRSRPRRCASGLHKAAPDITLAELRAALADEGIAVAVSTLWHFFARHHHTRNKGPAMRKSRIAPAC